MLVYKVTYVNNEPLFCEQSVYNSIKDKYTYQVYNGMLIYAHIKANDANEAKQTAREIVKSVTRNRPDC